MTTAAVAPWQSCPGFSEVGWKLANARQLGGQGQVGVGPEGVRYKPRKVNISRSRNHPLAESAAIVPVS